MERFVCIGHNSIVKPLDRLRRSVSSSTVVGVVVVVVVGVLGVVVGVEKAQLVLFRFG